MVTTSTLDPPEESPANALDAEGLMEDGSELPPYWLRGLANTSFVIGIVVGIVKTVAEEIGALVISGVGVLPRPDDAEDDVPLRID